MRTELSEKLKKTAKSMGASYFGVADLEPAGEFISRQGGEYLKQFSRAVSAGFRLLDSMVDQLQAHDSPIPVASYWYHVYHLVNPRLDSIGLEIARILQQQGHKAFVVPASHWDYKEGFRGIFSHKLAAHLAGLGWIGKSAMLITPGDGPRVRWVTVLTDTLLPAGKPMDEKCKDCTVCVESCPVKAYAGTNYGPSKTREDLMDAHKCYQFLVERKKSVGVFSCGKCVYVCPFGRKKKGSLRGASSLLKI